MPRRAARLSPAERREQLLGSAIAAFARAGVARAGHAEVARLAGVSVPTVFVYFPTRETLVDAVLDEVARYIVDDVLKPIQARPLDVPGLMRATALGFADFIESHPDHARVWLDWSTAVRDDVWPRYIAFQGEVLKLLKKTVARGKRDGSLLPGLDVDEATRLLVASGHMLAQMQFMHASRRQIERFVTTLIEGFRPREGIDTT